MGARLNSLFDLLVRPRVQVGPFSWSRYLVCGYAGLVLAIALAMALVTEAGLSRWVMARNVVLAIAAYGLVAGVTRLITGKQQLVYYHHQIAVLAVVAGLLRLSDQPVLPYLDVTILGIGLFLACGRIGCLMVGCCHGRPHAWGVLYGGDHVRAGYARTMMGVRLFPIQAVESAIVLAIVSAGSALVLAGAAGGEALSLYVVTYGVARYSLEFFRGDPGRPYLWGLSEGQWTSLLLLCALAAAEACGVMAMQTWHLAATLSLLGSSVLVIGRQARETRGPARREVALDGHR